MGGEYLYVMDDSPYGRKIGISNNPENRLKQIKSHNPRDIEVIYKYECDERSHALCLEKKLHKKFNKKNIRNEWFKIDDVDLEEIKKVCEGFYEHYETYGSWEDWFTQLNCKNLDAGLYTQFKLPTIKSIDVCNHNIIFEDHSWNQIFQDIYSPKIKESAKYLKEKLEILKYKSLPYFHTKMTLATLQEWQFTIFKESGMNWNRELEEYIHFFDSYEYYRRKNGMEILNIYNVYQGIPFTCVKSNERHNKLNFRCNLYRDIDEYVYFFIEKHIKENVRIKEPFNPLFFLENYIERFYNHTNNINIEIFDYEHKCIETPKVQNTIWTYNHGVSGVDKFCIKNMSKLHKKFIFTGFKEIYSIDFIKILKELKLSEENYESLLSQTF